MTDSDFSNRFLLLLSGYDWLNPLFFDKENRLVEFDMIGKQMNWQIVTSFENETVSEKKLNGNREMSVVFVSLDCKGERSKNTKEDVCLMFVMRGWIVFI